MGENTNNSTSGNKVKNSMMLNKMHDWLTNKQYPIVPTYFGNGVVTSDTFLETGWYAVKIDDKGLECISGTEINYLEDFDKCIKACRVHNKLTCGMTKGEISLFFVQRKY